MAIVTNTFTTFAAKGIRENLANIIYNISPEETPFQYQHWKRQRTKIRLYEWAELIHSKVCLKCMGHHAVMLGDN